jgi:hypothetical protein
MLCLLCSQPTLWTSDSFVFQQWILEVVDPWRSHDLIAATRPCQQGQGQIFICCSKFLYCIIWVNIILQRLTHLSDKYNSM